MYEDEDNDGRFPDESPVEVRYPRSIVPDRHPDSLGVPRDCGR